MRRIRPGREVHQVASVTSIAVAEAPVPAYYMRRLVAFSEILMATGVAEIDQSRETFKGCSANHKMEVNSQIFISCFHYNDISGNMIQASLRFRLPPISS